MDLHKELFQCFLFRDMEKEKAEKIIRLLEGRTKKYRKNEIVISEEKLVNEVGILISGELCKVQYYSD